MFRAHVLIIKRSKLHYTASGINKPIGGRLVHGLRDKQSEMHDQQNVKKNYSHNFIYINYYSEGTDKRI